jgi:carbon storage regulator
MLILGRRENQSIVFPNCGITVRILDVNGRVAKVGIEAPRSVEIMRGELAATSATSGPVATHPSSNSHAYEQACAPEHESALLQFEQRLADIKSSLHIFQQLRAAGDEAKADTILSNLLNDLAHLDKDCLDSHVEQPESPKRIASELVSESPTMYDYSPAIGQSPFYILIINAPNNVQIFTLPVGSFRGFQVCTVNSRSAANKAIDSNEPFDYIVCNGDSTVLDELELARKIRSNDKYDRTKVFFANESSSTLEKLRNAKEYGIDGWLAHPLVAQDLWNHIVESNQLES